MDVLNKCTHIFFYFIIIFPLYKYDFLPLKITDRYNDTNKYYIFIHFYLNKLKIIFIVFQKIIV